MKRLLLVAVALALTGCAAGGHAPSTAGLDKKEEVVANQTAEGAAWKCDLSPLERTIELNVGESREEELSDGSKARVKVLALQERRDDLRSAVREARVRVEVNGQEAEIVSATYNLPVTVGGVQVDCPITRGYLAAVRGDPWKLAADVRLRLWPAGSPRVQPGTLGYPVRQRWFATDTQMANEPTFVDGVETPGRGFVYYHDGLDFGGAEHLVEVVAATDGLVVTAGEAGLAGYEDAPVKPRYDSVSILDRRGWYHRYSHLATVELKPGQVVKLGQKVGTLGKEGDSGGWSHLHYSIQARQPSGRWGTHDGYAFVWQAYQAERGPKVIAVARPHHFAWAGDKVRLDGSKSWSAGGKIARYEWTFCDGTTATGAQVEHVYARAGEYSEILKVTDAAGNVDYDFAVVQVFERERPQAVPPALHVVYYPTFDVKPGEAVTFKARCFGTTDGKEAWDFGDGSPAATTKSDGCVDAHATDGYAILKHAYAKVGHYVVTVRRSNKAGLEATMRVHVRVGE